MLILWACFIQLTMMLRYHTLFSPIVLRPLITVPNALPSLNWDDSLTYMSFVDAENEKILLFPLSPSFVGGESSVQSGTSELGSVHPLENPADSSRAHFSVFSV